MRPIILGIVAVLVLLPTVGRARAETNLRTELAELAKEIKSLLDERHESSIVVGSFRGIDMPASAGPAFTSGLTEELKRLGVQVNLRAARLTVLGTFRPVEDERSGLAAIELKVSFEDNTGTPLGDLSRRVRSRGIFGDAAVAAIGGPTFLLPPSDPQARRQEVKKAFEAPHVHVTGSVVRAGDGPYAIEVLANRPQGHVEHQTYTPRHAEVREGFAFVPIARHEVYAVRLLNDSDHEAAVRLTIDGLSLFAFSEEKNEKTGEPRYEMLIVRPRSSLTVKGWHINNKDSDQFVVTEYARSAAAALSSSAAVGTITATFAAAWSKDGTAPPDEPANPAAFARSARDATGRGKRLESRYEVVERSFGVVRAAVSVRYAK